jgi:hypothetical protein
MLDTTTYILTFVYDMTQMLRVSLTIDFEAYRKIVGPEDFEYFNEADCRERIYAALPEWLDDENHVLINVARISEHVSLI